MAGATHPGFSSLEKDDGGIETPPSYHAGRAARRGANAGRRLGQIVLATIENTLLTLFPSKLMPLMITTATNAAISAYSKA